MQVWKRSIYHNSFSDKALTETKSTIYWIKKKYIVKMILMLIQRNEENGTEKELSLKTDQHLSTFIGRRGGGAGQGDPRIFVVSR